MRRILKSQKWATIRVETEISNIESKIARSRLLCIYLKEGKKREIMR